MMLAGGGQPPIGKSLGFALVEVEEGRVVFAGVPGPESYNLMNSAHGGYAATLLDSACGVATLTRLGVGQGMTTLELKVSYHRGITLETGVVRATGTTVSVGKRIAFAEAKLADASGRLLASATSTLLVMDR